MARGWTGALVDLVLPVQCLGCGIPEIAWCSACQDAACQLRLHSPDPAPVGFPPTVAAAEYAGDVRLAILGAKDRGRRDLVGPVATLLGWAAQAAVPPAERWLVVPMPSNPAAARARGGDHMVRIGLRATAGSGHLFVEALSAGHSGEATRLGAAGRLADRRRSMRLRRDAAALLAGRDVLLVDDIVTTGSTLATAAALVRSAGARAVRAAVVAATEKEVTRR
ncbi:ComF family protein [Epidermidibacterium keratini]|uniref:ComF family protein n=1 Tax=Epidermidibacterium keratini TaxID=1891644 RepID=A0A7L4YRM3_9ACTN|nr:phosphoribosyltransferase family protein [Epidermidibacterium keratini]QHC01564.1 ComF family protein [Epidermidibacterium keratini]